jgi:hypothetical protein
MSIRIKFELSSNASANFIVENIKVYNYMHKCKECITINHQYNRYNRYNIDMVRLYITQLGQLDIT